MKLFWFATLLLSISALLRPVMAQDVAVAEADEKLENLVSDMESELGLDPKEFGIRNGCISRSRIKSIRWIDDQSAIVRMMGKKKVLLTLRKECRGIKRHGYISKVKGNQLCERFDRMEVLKFGTLCVVESLEPYIELPDTSADSDK